MLGCGTSGKRLTAGDLLSEDLSRKFFDARLLTSPCPRFQSSLNTSLVEESLAVPSVFDGDLRQKEPRIAAAADNQTVASDFDFFDVAHRLDRSHHRDLQL